MKIAQLGQPVLRQRAREVTAEEIATPDFQRFVADLHETLRAEHGAGLAAPQVFQDVRVFAAAILPPADPDDDPEIETFINPRFIEQSEQTVDGWEGCLSFPELLVLVPRHRTVRIEYLNQYGAPSILEATGFAARVLQHEFDHLEGVLTLDRAKSSKHIIKATELAAHLGEEQPDEADDE